MKGVYGMSAPVPHDGIVVRNARLAVKNELEKKRLLNQPIQDLTRKAARFIWNTLMAPRPLWERL